jgi:hypothetical protein
MRLTTRVTRSSLAGGQKKIPASKWNAVRAAGGTFGLACIASRSVEKTVASAAGPPILLTGGFRGTLMVVWKHEVPADGGVRPARRAHSDANILRAIEDAVTFFAEPPLRLPSALRRVLVIVRKAEVPAKRKVSTTALDYRVRCPANKISVLIVDRDVAKEDVKPPTMLGVRA